MATIKEDYVSFETAKLLKEKGFDERCTHYYKNEKYLVDLGNSNIHSYANSDLVEEFVAPTLQMAMKWLRKEHNIHIQIWILEEKGYWFDVEKILNAQYKHKSLYSTGLEDIYFESYEEACEAAIKYSLENLI